MAERIRARDLLQEARSLFDAPGSPLAASARSAGRTAFSSGGQWMQSAMESIRGEKLPGARSSLQWLGILKYAVATSAALGVTLLAWFVRWPILLPMCVVAFYAAEAQMVFLIPLALDGESLLFPESRRLTVRAGGTLAVMRVVLPLAATMCFGGFLGRGFIRSWCLGCIAVCIWYEQIRPRMTVRVLNDSCCSFQFGAFGSLHVRHERIGLGLARRVVVLYASDLHLGWPWSNPLARQLVSVVRDLRPEAVILGGDLADTGGGLNLLSQCITQMAAISLVYALPGNHDVRFGIDRISQAVKSSGGKWLADQSGPRPSIGAGEVELHAEVLPDEKTSSLRILCTHDPAIFPAAVRAGYRLVLAGHLHGGQCVLKTHNGRLYPGAFFARWTGLRFNEGDSTMIVSRGAADTLPFRWNCPREVIVCEIA